MNRRTITLIFLIVLVPVVVYLLFPSDTKRIKKLFREGAAAVEKKDVDAVMSKVSFNYRDEYGFTYLYLRESMKALFQRMNAIRVDYDNLKVEVKDGAARADLDVKVIVSAGDETNYLLGDVSEPVHLTFTLQKERTKWLITKTEGLPFDEHGI